MNFPIGLKSSACRPNSLKAAVMKIGNSAESGRGGSRGQRISNATSDCLVVRRACGLSPATTNNAPEAVCTRKGSLRRQRPPLPFARVPQIRRPRIERVPGLAAGPNRSARNPFPLTAVFKAAPAVRFVAQWHANDDDKSRVNKEGAHTWDID